MELKESSHDDGFQSNIQRNIKNMYFRLISSLMKSGVILENIQ